MGSHPGKKGGFNSDILSESHSVATTHPSQEKRQTISPSEVVLETESSQLVQSANTSQDGSSIHPQQDSGEVACVPARKMTAFDIEPPSNILPEDTQMQRQHAMPSTMMMASHSLDLSVVSSSLLESLDLIPPKVGNDRQKSKGTSSIAVGLPLWTKPEEADGPIIDTQHWRSTTDEENCQDLLGSQGRRASAINSNNDDHRHQVTSTDSSEGAISRQAPPRQIPFASRQQTFQKGKFAPQPVISSSWVESVDLQPPMKQADCKLEEPKDDRFLAGMELPHYDNMHVVVAKKIDSSLNLEAPTLPYLDETSSTSDGKEKEYKHRTSSGNIGLPAVSTKPPEDGGQKLSSQVTIAEDNQSGGNGLSNHNVLMSSKQAGGGDDQAIFLVSSMDQSADKPAGGNVCTQKEAPPQQTQIVSIPVIPSTRMESVDLRPPVANAESNLVPGNNDLSGRGMVPSHAGALCVVSVKKTGCLDLAPPTESDSVASKPALEEHAPELPIISDIIKQRANDESSSSSSNVSKTADGGILVKHIVSSQGPSSSKDDRVVKTSDVGQHIGLQAPLSSLEIGITETVSPMTHSVSRQIPLLIAAPSRQHIGSIPPALQRHAMNLGLGPQKAQDPSDEASNSTTASLQADAAGAPGENQTACPEIDVPRRVSLLAIGEVLSVIPDQLLPDNYQVAQGIQKSHTKQEEVVVAASPINISLHKISPVPNALVECPVSNLEAEKMEAQITMVSKGSPAAPSASSDPAESPVSQPSGAKKEVSSTPGTAQVGMADPLVFTFGRKSGQLADPPLSNQIQLDAPVVALTQQLASSVCTPEPSLSAAGDPSSPVGSGSCRSPSSEGSLLMKAKKRSLRDVVTTDDFDNFKPHGKDAPPSPLGSSRKHKEKSSPKEKKNAGNQSPRQHEHSRKAPAASTFKFEIDDEIHLKVEKRAKEARQARTGFMSPAARSPAWSPVASKASQYRGEKPDMEELVNSYVELVCEDFSTNSKSLSHDGSSRAFNV